MTGNENREGFLENQQTCHDMFHVYVSKRDTFWGWGLEISGARERGL